MVNVNLKVLTAFISELTLQDTLLNQMDRGTSFFPDKPDGVIDNAIRERLEGWIFNLGQSVAEEYELTAALERIKRFKKIMSKPNVTNREIHFQVKELRAAIDEGLKKQLIYRYPSAKAKTVAQWKADWKSVTQLLPGTEADVWAGVDLWALGHYTASVFHMTRILEHGLVELAKSVGCNIESENWHNIINEIEKAIKQLRERLPRGTAKSERIRFLSEAAKEFSYFKDGWRNYVSHNKCIYDEGQAEAIMQHTRHFMTLLATKLPTDRLAPSTAP